MRFMTQAVHAGRPHNGGNGPLTEPIHQTSTFVWASLLEPPEYQYTRYSNPNRTSVELTLAALEGAKHCTCYSSGMAAIVAAMSLLKAGDEVLLASDIYGGTSNFARLYFENQGITYKEFDASKTDEIEALSSPKTKMVVFESPTNPNLRVIDIATICGYAKKHGWITVFDNTFATCYLQNPLELGVDVVVHSTTKYLSGHSDISGGAALTNNDEFGHLLYQYVKVAGSNPSPFDCFLVLRGLKTLALRMRQHCVGAQAVAEFLESHPKVTRACYPGLHSHPEHQLARRQMRGFGGMLAADFDTNEKGIEVLGKGLKLFTPAASLGGVESLVSYPKLMSHAGLTEEQRMARGIPPTMLRFSVGIEDPQDLIDDLSNALEAI